MLVALNPTGANERYAIDRVTGNELECILGAVKPG